MEETNNTLEQQPYYTRQWLTLQVVYSLLIAGLAAIPALAIKELAHDRFTQILLSDRSYNMVTESTYYCSIVVALTLLTLSVIDMVFRKHVETLQHILIGIAITLFYLLLLSFAEFLPFAASYAIVGAMTIGLIALFVKGITHSAKAMGIVVALLVAEYGLIFLLLNLGTASLLVGSLFLFAIIALAMYFTIKLKFINDEFTIS